MNIRKAFPKKKMKHRKENQLLSVLSLLLIVCILSNVGIAALYPQIVYASFSGTVAGYILTLFASFNTAITNPNVVTAINNTFGSVALEAADAGVIDQGIAQIASTTGFDMAQIFSNTAAEAEQVIAAGWDTISTTAQTAGENLAEGAHFASIAGMVLPAIGGTVLPAAGAVGAGVGLGFLIDKARHALTDYIKGGKPLDTPQSEMQYISLYPNQASYGYSGKRYIISCGDGCIPIGYRSRDNPNVFWVGILSYSDNTVQNVWVQPQSEPTYFDVEPNGIWLSPHTLWIDDYYQGLTIIDYGQWQTYQSNIKNGVIPDPTYNKYAPDIIGNIGNQRGTVDNGNFTTPYITTIYDYGNTVINYIDPSDYQDFVDRANDNTHTGDTGEDTQGQDFDDFVDPYITPIETDQPVDPENPIPQPTISPVQPVIPPQPTPAPEPTLTPEETDEMPRGMVQPSLKDKFPFCIPFDIGYLLNKMSAEREAPRFVWKLDFGQWGQYTITVDLSPFDSVAAILRTLELILFILGLMLATKSLMSTSDGG